MQIGLKKKEPDGIRVGSASGSGRAELIGRSVSSFDRIFFIGSCLSLEDFARCGQQTNESGMILESVFDVGGVLHIIFGIPSNQEPSIPGTINGPFRPDAPNCTEYCSFSCGH